MVCCWVPSDRYVTDRCMLLTVVRNRVVGMWFVVGRWDRYGADPCTVMAIAPNRVVGPWFAVRYREIYTVLILAQ